MHGNGSRTRLDRLARRRAAAAGRRTAHGWPAADDEPADPAEGFVARTGAHDDGGLHRGARRAVQLLPRPGRARRAQRHGRRRKANQEGRAWHDAPRAGHQHQAARGGRQGRRRDDARRLRDLPPRRADPETDHRHHDRGGHGRRIGSGHREVQRDAREVLPGPELRLRRDDDAHDGAARQHRRQGRRRAGLPAGQRRVLPEVGPHLLRHRADEERQGR